MAFKTFEDKPGVGIVMGSDSDLGVMKEAAAVLKNSMFRLKSPLPRRIAARKGRRNLRQQPVTAASGWSLRVPATPHTLPVRWLLTRLCR
jgi:hypothetical protein